jgi:hypothetical protein
MAFNGILGLGITTATNPNPNTLSVINPFTDPFISVDNPNPAWPGQGTKALLYTWKPTLYVPQKKPIAIAAFAQDGDDINFELGLWLYVRLAEGWAPLVNNGIISIAGRGVAYIDAPDEDTAIGIELISIDHDTNDAVDVYYDKSVARDI